MSIAETMEKVAYSKPAALSLIIIAGPIGCATLYYLFFILRPYSPDTYPDLSTYLGIYNIIFEFLILISILFIATVFFKSQNIQRFKKQNRSIPVSILIILTVITAGLMALTFYRVYGHINFDTIAGDYARYYAVSRIGGAWIIWAGYGILFIILADMFFGSVTIANSSSILICILLNSVTGGRTLPLMIMLAFLFLLYFQKPKIISMITAVFMCLVIALSSYFLVSALRSGKIEQVSLPFVAEQAINQIETAVAPKEPKSRDVSGNNNSNSPINDWQSLNYNAAFIIDDVLRRLRDGSLSSEPHAINNFSLLIPRFVNTNKLRSDSETRSVYPIVADRGTTISFPLKANIMLHLGEKGTFYANWVVILIFQLGFIWSISQRERKPGPFSFITFYFGCAYFFIERAGIFNSRLLIHLAVLLVAYACYRLATSVWFLNVLSTLKLARRPDAVMR